MQEEEAEIEYVTEEIDLHSFGLPMAFKTHHEGAAEDECADDVTSNRRHPRHHNTNLNQRHNRHANVMQHPQGAPPLMRAPMLHPQPPMPPQPHDVMRLEGRPFRELRPHAEIPPQLHASRPPLLATPGLQPPPHMTSQLRHPPPHLLNQAPGVLGAMPRGLPPGTPPRPGVLEHEAGMRPNSMLLQQMMPNQPRLPPHSVHGGQLILNPALLHNHPGMRQFRPPHNLMQTPPPLQAGAPVVTGQNPMMEPRLPMPLDMRPTLLAPDGSPVSTHSTLKP